MKKISVNQIIIVSLIVISVFSAVSLVLQYQAFRKERYSLQEIISLTKQENLKLKQELESTQEKLELYNQVLKERDDLQQELGELKTTLRESQDLLTQAKTDKDILAKEAKVLDSELKTLQSQTRLLEGKIEGLDEVKSALRTRIKGIKELRDRIKSFKRQAFLNKVKAQQEIDRVRLEKGNRGFVKKDGQFTVGTIKAVELQKIIIKTEPNEPKSKGR